ncbi:ScbR family autoregulator-binding transcription factor [Curtobacterium sp. 22159]|uniref:ScbR family autoregulator-binding transcription factor n=1 Tax=Curtobacterium sp. 22159 TaxID=3453882 RepID=UPI003F863155
MPRRSAPTQERAVQTRAAVIAGAAAVFHQRGYANASLDQISDESGVTRGAMYFHFPSKEAIANAVIAEQHRIVRDEAETVLARAGSAFEAVVMMCESFARQLSDDEIVRAGIRLTTEGSAEDLSTIAPYEDWIATMQNLFRLAIEQGDVREDIDPVALGRFVVASYTGVQLVSGTLTRRTDLFDRMREMWVILVPGIIRPERQPAALQLAKQFSR